ncbi:MAG: hypothetical protein J7647_21335 [Cyanobacteria bacterium SBLK]|nr:hypothetical protein [Cyanobacteria bacterium SBLK]
MTWVRKFKIKGFTSRSAIADLEQALGQYLLYRAVLEEVREDCLLYLAIPRATYQGIFSEPIGTLIVNKYRLNLLVFDAKNIALIILNKNGQSTPSLESRDRP